MDYHSRMGLDMYLTKKTYVRSGTIRTDIDPERISYITEEVGYWRKANQIHKWFVDNVQEGNDNCGDYYVSKEKLKELYNICIAIKSETKLVDGKIIENSHLAVSLLPTTEGFFFGSTDYDEFYMRNIDDTIKILKPILDIESNDGDYYYHSSW